MDARKYVLPDYLKPGLDVVIVVSIVATTSDAAGNYYAQSGNKFWERLYRTGLTPRQPAPQEDSTVLDFGIGSTDLNKTESSSTDVGVEHDVAYVLQRMEGMHPARVAFNGKGMAGFYCKQTRSPFRVYCGLQPWTIGSSRVFVAPSTSGSLPQTVGLDGKLPEQHWRSLGVLVRGSEARSEAAS